MASILIVDDQPEILRALRRILESQGHTVTEAQDGKAAIQRFAVQPTDLVFTDMFMPEMDGIEFILELRKAFPETRVIAMSGGGILPRDQILDNADVLGADVLLRKPFTTQKVLEVVDGVLEQGK